MDYKPGHFSKPVLAWFGKEWTPKVNWKPVQQIATRTSENGDNFTLRGTPEKWPATRRVPK